MQHGQSFAGFDDSLCVEFHARATGEESIISVADGVMAGNRLAACNQNRTGLVQHHYRFDVARIEGSFEENVNLGWRGCGHWFD
jgi:hypothetical protein